LAQVRPKSRAMDAFLESDAGRGRGGHRWCPCRASHSVEWSPLPSGSPSAPTRVTCRDVFTMASGYLVALALVMVPPHTDGDLPSGGAAWGDTVRLDAEAASPLEALAAAHANDCAESGCPDCGTTGSAETPRVLSTPGNGIPERYWKVREKTIWSYWYNAKTCPSSKNCTLPPLVKLCMESVQRNRGSFEHRLVHRDEVHRYVDMRTELPAVWSYLRPQIQKDALNNALLARYGGVAIDITTILLRPLDDYWDEMVRAKAGFRGYMYRLDGRPWPNPMSTAVWFLMARREGIFRTVAAHQAMAYPPDAEGIPPAMVPRVVQFLDYSTFGDHILTPVLSMVNYSLPKCYEDEAVDKPEMCPEYRAPNWAAGMTGPPRNDTRLLLRDPRDGPVFSFSHSDEGMASWNVTDGSRMPCLREGGGLECCSQRECWETVFLRRHRAPPPPGESTPPLSFVKLFGHGGVALRRRSREAILAQRDTYFVNWLRLAGLDV